MASMKARRRSRFYATQKTLRQGYRDLEENTRLAMILNGWR